MLIEGCMYVYVDLCGFMALVGYLESECPALSGYLCVCVCVCMCVCVSLCSCESFSGEKPAPWCTGCCQCLTVKFKKSLKRPKWNPFCTHGQWRSFFLIRNSHQIALKYGIGDVITTVNRTQRILYQMPTENVTPIKIAIIDFSSYMKYRPIWNRFVGFVFNKRSNNNSIVKVLWTVIVYSGSDSTL